MEGKARVPRYIRGRHHRLRIVADPAYLKALAAGHQVSAIACERPGSAQVFYTRTNRRADDVASNARSS
jgi:hypothetical protein